MIRIVLSGEPKGKGRPRFSVRNGQARAFTPASTRSYEGALKLAAQDQMGDTPPLDCAVDVTILSYMPIPKSWSKKKQAAALAGTLRPTGKPDWDNMAKMTDALNEVVWRDDGQVVDGRVRKFYSDRPRLEIVVEPVLDFME
jgi:Holliday junction resolvase RusA-like endonuclease